MNLLSKRYQLLLGYLGGLEAVSQLPAGVLIELVRRPAEQTVIINCANYVFDLRSPYGFTSLVVGDIYAVHNQAGRLLYQVARHGGIWGRNELDARLVYSSRPYQLYYVQLIGGQVYTLLRGTDPERALVEPVSPAITGIECTLALLGPGKAYLYAAARVESPSAARVRAAEMWVIGGELTPLVITRPTWVYLETPAGLPSSAVLPGDRLGNLYHVLPSSPPTQVII